MNLHQPLHRLILICWGLALLTIYTNTSRAAIPAISAGGSHSLSLKTDGSVWAYGSNDYGQLGDGTTAPKTTPVKVLTDVSAISAGYDHSLLV